MTRLSECTEVWDCSYSNSASPLLDRAAPQGVHMLDGGLVPSSQVLQVLLNQPLCSRWTSASLVAFPQI